MVGLAPPAPPAPLDPVDETERETPGPDQPAPHDRERLMPAVYQSLRALASAWFRRERGPEALEPTALVHEAYLRLADQSLPEIKSRTHFFALAAREMRRMLVDHARAARADKRGGARRRVTLHEDLPGQPQRTVDLIALDEALDRLAALHERQAQVVQLRYFGGLTVPEVAEELGLSVTAIEQDWRVARAWLLREIGAQEAGA